MAGQVDRQPGRASRRCARGRGVERAARAPRRGRCVAEREMERAALLVGDDLGEPPVEVPLSSSAACRFAAAASSGCAARTRSPSMVTTPASTARSSASGPARSASWLTRRSASRATARSTLRAESSRSATRRPSRSSTWSGTGRSSPRVSRSRPASIRPTSMANSGFPIVVLVDPPQHVVRQAQSEPGGQDLPRCAEADRPDDDAHRALVRERLSPTPYAGPVAGPAGT